MAGQFCPNKGNRLWASSLCATRHHIFSSLHQLFHFSLSPLAPPLSSQVVGLWLAHRHLWLKSHMNHLKWCVCPCGQSDWRLPMCLSCSKVDCLRSLQLLKYTVAISNLFIEESVDVCVAAKGFWLSCQTMTSTSQRFHRELQSWRRDFISEKVCCCCCCCCECLSCSSWVDDQLWRRSLLTLVRNYTEC